MVEPLGSYTAVRLRWSIEAFVLENQDFGAKKCDRLIPLLDQPDFTTLLRHEMAIAVNFCVHFVKTTYSLEGDGPLIHRC